MEKMIKTMRFKDKKNSVMIQRTKWISVLSRNNNSKINKYHLKEAHPMSEWGYLRWVLSKLKWNTKIDANSSCNYSLQNRIHSKKHKVTAMAVAVIDRLLIRITTRTKVKELLLIKNKKVFRKMQQRKFNPSNKDLWWAHRMVQNSSRII